MPISNRVTVEPARVRCWLCGDCGSILGQTTDVFEYRGPRDSDAYGAGPVLRESRPPRCSGCAEGGHAHEVDADMYAVLIRNRSGAMGARTPAEPSPTWRPIGTAPRDRKPVILYGVDGQTAWVTIGVYRGASHDWETQLQYAVGPTDRLRSPTHWMPIPEMPK